MPVIDGGHDAIPFKAKMFIPCIVGECTSNTNGKEYHSRMQLILWREYDGALLQRPFNDGPVYRCERVGCYYHDNPRGLHTLSSKWIRDAGRYEAPMSNTDELKERFEVMV